MKKLFFKINKNKNHIKKIINIILLFISVGIIFYFFVDNNNYLKLIDALPHLNALWILIAFLSLSFSWYFDSLSIKFLSDTISAHNNHGQMSFLKISICGQYFHAITPMGIGSQPAQILKLSSKNISKDKAVIIIFQKYIIYKTCLFFYSLVFFFIYRNHIKECCPKIIIMIAVGLISQGLVLIIIKIIFSNKNVIIKILKVILNLIFRIKIIKNKTLSLKIWICSFLQINFLFSVPFFIFKAFNHVTNPVLEILCTQSVVNTISSFTPLPGSCGTAEESFLSLFSTIFSAEEIVSAMLLSRFITFYSIIVIGYIINNFISK